MSLAQSGCGLLATLRFQPPAVEGSPPRLRCKLINAQQRRYQSGCFNAETCTVASQLSRSNGAAFDGAVRAQGVLGSQRKGEPKLYGVKIS
jgi:hypothetical protein